MYCNHNSDKIQPFPELSEGICPVDFAKRSIAVAQQLNCGKSVMCRDGMTQLQQIIEDQTRGRGQPDDLELLRDLCKVIADTDGCELSSKAAANILLSLERDFDVWSQHCLRKRCAELVCKAYYSVYIDPERCNGCGSCLQMAPSGAIEGGSGLIHVVRDDSGLKSEEAFAVCPCGALKKAGSVKPRVPENPVPIGSFVSGGRRRQRSGD